MGEKRSWLSKNYTGNTYKFGIDVDSAMTKRRKALDEINDLLREKWLKQIDLAMKQE